jgi:hypothetical protein
MHLRPLAILFFAASAAAAQAQALLAPTGLQVTAASRSQVALTWTASAGAASSQVERQAESGSFVTVGAPVTATSATDTTIDAYTDYNYRVRAEKPGPTPTAPPILSAPSNVVPVGPIPVGYNYALMTPENAEGDFGDSLKMILDANDDPVFVYGFRDPNRDGKVEETSLYFEGWDRAHFKWRPVQKLDVVGDFPDRRTPFSLALDPSNGELALAWLRGDGSTMAAFSTDDGVTWKQEQVHLPDGEPSPSSNSIGIASGNVYLAYFSGGNPLYMTGNAADDPSKWTSTHPPAKDSYTFRDIGDLAVDSSGKPAVIYYLAPESGGVEAYFWRPSGTSLNKATDSGGRQNDSPSVHLSFMGTKPRLVLAISRDDVDVHTLWFTASDDGSAWSAPVVVPSDGNRLMIAPLSLAITSQGAYAVTADDNVGNFDGMKCGWPKIARSQDGTSWATCSPNPTNRDLTSLTNSAAYAGNNHLYVGFRRMGKDQGLMVWREGASQAENIVIHKNPAPTPPPNPPAQ